MSPKREERPMSETPSKPTTIDEAIAAEQRERYFKEHPRPPGPLVYSTPERAYAARRAGILAPDPEADQEVLAARAAKAQGAEAARLQAEEAARAAKVIAEQAQAFAQQAEARARAARGRGPKG